MKKLLLIAGPCVIENAEMLKTVCATMQPLCEKYGFDYVFKASFDKANRSSINSFRGPGLSEGLRMLEDIRKQFGVRTTTDIHTPDQIEPASKAVNIIQLPAFLARQTDFYVEAGRLNVELNVKKGQFMSASEMKTAIEKFRQSGGKTISIIERGTFMGYGNLVVDFRSVDIIKKMGVPYIFDATHSVQLPAAGNGTSLGDRSFIPTLVKAQLAAGADGVFMEVHPNPSVAKSDAATQLPLDKADAVLSMMRDYYQFAQEHPHKLEI